MKVMKKIFKSRVLLVIVTVILTGSISVYAAGRYYATQVEYEPSNPNFNVDNMSDALDELYEKTKNYKNLSTPTDVEANTLLSGKKAYKSDGTLVTGSIPNISSGNTNLTSGQVYTIPQGYHDGTGTITAPTSNTIYTNTFTASSSKAVTVNLGFRPTNVIIKGTKSGFSYYEIQGSIGSAYAASNGSGDMNSYIEITNTGFNYGPCWSTENGSNVRYWAW